MTLERRAISAFAACAPRCYLLCSPLMDDSDCRDRQEKRGQLVSITQQRDVVGSARHGTEMASGLVETASLTTTERAVLFGESPVDEITQAAALITAATGLMKLAAQHVARRLAAPSAPTLTAQDRMAMALVPSLAVQLRQGGPTRNTPEGTVPGARDPILELLVKVENHPGDSETVGEQTAMSSRQDLVRFP
jgi:hypothetical protein